MARVGEAFVQRQKAAHKTLGVLGDGLRKIAALGRDRADDGHAARRAGKGLHAARAFIERGQAAGQVGGEALFGGHLLQTAGDLAQRFCPAGRGIRHHGHVVAHVAVVFRQRDARVDGRLACGHGHIAGISDEHRALRHGLAAFGVDQLAEFVQHLRHLVAALAAAHIDDDVRVAPLGKLVLRHRLAGAEAAGNGGRAALCNGKQRVDDALARDERTADGLPRGHGTGRADGPLLCQTNGLFLTGGRRYLTDGVRHGILAVFSGPGNDAGNIRGHHAFVGDDAGLRAGCDDGAARNAVAGLDGDGHIPPAGHIQAVHMDARGDERAVFLGDIRERTLDAVKNIFHDAGPERGGERRAGALDGLTHQQAGGVLVHLDGGARFADADDLADEARVSDVHHLRHAERAGILHRDDRPVDRINYIFHRLAPNSRPSGKNA